jgi:hypothetical protein
VQGDRPHQGVEAAARASMTHATPAGASAEAILDRFIAAWNRHDLAAALAMTSTNCVFEAAVPLPGGERCIGHTELEAAWKPIFDDPSSQLTVEDSFTTGESFVAGTRVVQRWRFDWAEGQVRGVDLLTVRDGLITEKLAYVKA